MYQKCPVCEGRQKVPAGFYELRNIWKTQSATSTTIAIETCRTCMGTGIIEFPPELVKLEFPKEETTP